MSVIVIVQTFYFLTLQVSVFQLWSRLSSFLNVFGRCNNFQLSARLCEFIAVKLLIWLVLQFQKRINSTSDIHFFFVNTWTPRPHFSADSRVKSEAMWAAGKRIFIKWETSYPIHHCLCWLKCSEFFQKPPFFLINDFKVCQKLIQWWSNRKEAFYI